MDALTERMVQADKDRLEAEKRGYPNIPVKCWECGVVENKGADVIPLSDWLKWEANGRKTLRGVCSKHDYSED